MSQGLELVFVAVYQKALKLMYVDRLLERMKAEFVLQYDPKVSLCTLLNPTRGPQSWPACFASGFRSQGDEHSLLWEGAADAVAGCPGV